MDRDPGRRTAGWIHPLLFERWCLSQLSKPSGCDLVGRARARVLPLADLGNTRWNGRGPSETPLFLLLLRVQRRNVTVVTFVTPRLSLALARDVFRPLLLPTPLLLLLSTWEALPHPYVFCARNGVTGVTMVTRLCNRLKCGYLGALRASVTQARSCYYSAYLARRRIISRRSELVGMARWMRSSASCTSGARAQR